MGDRDEIAALSIPLRIGSGRKELRTKEQQSRKWVLGHGMKDREERAAMVQIVQIVDLVNKN